MLRSTWALSSRLDGFHTSCKPWESVIVGDSIASESDDIELMEYKNEPLKQKLTWRVCGRWSGRLQCCMVSFFHFFFIVSVSSSFEGAQTEKRRTGQFSFCEAWPLNSLLKEPEDDAANVWGQASILCRYESSPKMFSMQTPRYKFSNVRTVQQTVCSVCIPVRPRGPGTMLGSKPRVSTFDFRT